MTLHAHHVLLDHGCLLAEVLCDFAGQTLWLVLDEWWWLGEGDFGAVVDKRRSSLAGYRLRGDDVGGGNGADRYFVVVGVQFLGGVQSRGLVHHTVRQRGEVVALLRLDNVGVQVGLGVAGLGVGGSKAWNTRRKVHLSVTFPLSLCSQVHRSVDLGSERSNLYTLLEYPPVLLLVFTGSVRDLHRILWRIKTLN